MEQSNRIQRSEEWKKIYEIIKQLPIKNESGCDAMDASSAATEIEALFLKLFCLQNVSGSLPVHSSTELIELANNRRDMVERKEFDWRSYYNGFLDGFATYFNKTKQ